MPAADDRLVGSVAIMDAVEGKAEDKIKDDAKDSSGVGGIKNPKKGADAGQPALPEKEAKSQATISSSLNQQMMQHGFMNPGLSAGIGANPLWGFGGYAGPMLFPGAASGMAALGAMHQQVE